MIINLNKRKFLVYLVVKTIYIYKRLKYSESPKNNKYNNIYQHFREEICLDEADFILEDEGINRIKEIFGLTKPDIQILLISNKKTPQIINIMDDMIHDPVKIVAKESSLRKNRQFYVNIDKDEYKFPTLIDIYGQLSCQKVVIFVNKYNPIILIFKITNLILNFNIKNKY